MSDQPSAMGPSPAGSLEPPFSGQPGSEEPDRPLLVELNALLGRGTRYAGNLSFEGRVRIEGRFSGDIRGDVLVIGEGAEVDGDIEVDVCVVTGGRVRAGIRARSAIELHAPAIVHGDLHAPNVFIDRGVQFQGACTMAPLDERESDDVLAERAAALATDPLPAHDDAAVLGAGEERREPQDPP
jgi:cytoskeletal protein CcmA (bactofilin family)